MKRIQVHFPNDWDSQRTYTYEAPDDVEVGDEVAVPTVQWLTIVAVGSDYTGQCRSVVDIRKRKVRP